MKLCWKIRWNIGAPAMFYLGQCGNEFWVRTNSGGILGVPDSLLHEFTRADSFHFISILLVCDRLILHVCDRLILHVHFTYFF